MKTAHLGIAVCCIFAACSSDSRTAPPRGDRSGDTPAAGSSSITPTEFVTSLTFLIGDADPASGLVLRVANFATRSGIERTYRAWYLDRAGWRALMTTELRDGPMRAPWRVFPTDSLRIVVDAEGDTERLIIKARPANYSIQLEERLDAWEDAVGTRNEVRLAILERRGRRIMGVVLQQRFTVPRPDHPTAFGPYERVVLSSEDGAVIVLFNTRDPATYGEPFAWMYADGLTHRWNDLEARTVEVENSVQLRRNIPVRSWFRIAEPDIRCELTLTTQAIEELAAESGPKPYNALYRVSGWIEFAGERRAVRGIMERGEN